MDPMIMSVDGNFRLCRRKKAGNLRKDIKPFLHSSFFVDQNEVDSYILSEQRPIAVTLAQVHVYLLCVTMCMSVCLLSQRMGLSFNRASVVTSRLEMPSDLEHATRDWMKLVCWELYAAMTSPSRC